VCASARARLVVDSSVMSHDFNKVLRDEISKRSELEFSHKECIHLRVNHRERRGDSEDSELGLDEIHDS
jgi:hypothetical protein